MKRETWQTRIRRFFVPTDDAECWVWRAGITGRGYGAFWRDGQTLSAHRLVYELLVGPIPEGMTLDHLCRNRACVNPAHLEPVTMGENLSRSPIAPSTINGAKTHCPSGHEYDTVNTYVNAGTRRRHCRACARAHQARYAREKRAGLR